MLPPREEETATAVVVSVPTGLSEEEDAGRHLEIKFNRQVMFCTNCEGYYGGDMDEGDDICPVCDIWMHAVGTPPRGYKRKL